MLLFLPDFTCFYLKTVLQNWKLALSKYSSITFHISEEKSSMDALLAPTSRALSNKSSHATCDLYRHLDYRWRLLCPCLLFVQVWVSSVTEIRQQDLRAQDLDTHPDELHFMVTPPSNGHLALKSAPMKAVLNFTQAHIDKGQLLFVHKGNAASQGRNCFNS